MNAGHSLGDGGAQNVNAALALDPTDNKDGDKEGDINKTGDYAALPHEEHKDVSELVIEDPPNLHLLPDVQNAEGDANPTKEASSNKESMEQLPESEIVQIRDDGDDDMEYRTQLERISQSQTNPGVLDLVFSMS